MSKTTTTDYTQNFAKAAKVGDLNAAVRAARAALGANLFTGRVDDDPGSLIDLLLGEDDRPRLTLSGDAWQQHCTQLYAAIAMGIAIGQLVHPDAFTMGERR
jgi:hypothetical protein